VSRLRRLFQGGSDGNARLTAAAAVVLLVLLAAEGLTLLGGVGRLLTPHIFIGLLLIPPVALKLASVGWRMTSYYRRVEEYVRKGPPHALLRMVVAPVLPLIRVALDTLHCLDTGHVRIGACLASFQGISRTQSEGGDCPK